MASSRALLLTARSQAIKNPQLPCLVPLSNLYSSSRSISNRSCSHHTTNSAHHSFHRRQPHHQKRTKATLANTANSATMPSTNDFAKTLKALHKPGQPLILSNVWDLPSLNSLIALNTETEGGNKPVKAVATASWALANARGVKDEDLTAEQNLDAIRALAPVAAAAGLPLSADLQDGYGSRIHEIFTTAAQYGVAGANLEDSIPSAGFGQGIAGSLYSKEDAVERIKTALKAAADAGVPDFVINARCDVFKLDNGPGLEDEVRMKEALDRAKAYLAAGATTVFLWGGGGRGLRTAEVKKLVEELDGRVAVLLTTRVGAHSTAELADIGVARISIGPSLYLVAMNAFKTGAAKILAGGRL